MKPSCNPAAPGVPPPGDQDDEDDGSYFGLLDEDADYPNHPIFLHKLNINFHWICVHRFHSIQSIVLHPLKNIVIEKIKYQTHVGREIFKKKKLKQS